MLVRDRAMTSNDRSAKMRFAVASSAVRATSNEGLTLLVGEQHALAQVQRKQCNHRASSKTVASPMPVDAPLMITLEGALTAIRGLRVPRVHRG